MNACDYTPAAAKRYIAAIGRSNVRLRRERIYDQRAAHAAEKDLARYIERLDPHLRTVR